MKAPFPFSNWFETLIWGLPYLFVSSLDLLWRKWKGYCRPYCTDYKSHRTGGLGLKCKKCGREV